MLSIECKACGSKELLRDGSHYVCAYCGSRFAIEKDDVGITESRISVKSDVQALLEKCRLDPKNARKYANLVLDIDPDNTEALRYI